MQKGSKHTDESRQRIREGSLGRVSPISLLREQLAASQSSEAQLRERHDRLREVFRRHREIVDKGRKQAEGNPIRSFMDELMAAWEDEG